MNIPVRHHNLSPEGGTMLDRIRLKAGGTIEGVVMHAPCPVCRSKRSLLDIKASATLTRTGAIALFCYASECAPCEIARAWDIPESNVVLDYEALRDAASVRSLHRERATKAAETVWRRSSNPTGIAVEGYFRALGVTGTLPKTIFAGKVPDLNIVKPVQNIVLAQNTAGGLLQLYLGSDGQPLFAGRWFPIGPLKGAVLLSEDRAGLIVTNTIEQGMMRLSGALGGLPDNRDWTVAVVHSPDVLCALRLPPGRASLILDIPINGRWRDPVARVRSRASALGSNIF